MSFLDSRSSLIASLDHESSFDLLVIGGGATGLFTAYEAAKRGLKVALLESHDYASGTSSKSSKLLHGGVRYLGQGHFQLVRQALHERTYFLNWAPHLAQPLAFALPTSSISSQLFYKSGLKFYEWLSGKDSLGKTVSITKNDLLNQWSLLKTERFNGGVIYWDAQFDDARMALWIASEAQRHHAVTINYAEVTRLNTISPGNYKIEWRDTDNDTSHTLFAKCVVNASGVWLDHVRKLRSDLSNPSDNEKLIYPSQGIHLVVKWPDSMGHPPNLAIINPKTSDGRVLFWIPWMGHWLIGTTDTPVSSIDYHPKPLESEIDFLLKESSAYLNVKLERHHVSSVWAGLRPLKHPNLSNTSASTPRISREHDIHLDTDGLINISGGKWTTARIMALDTLKFAKEHHLIPSIELEKDEYARDYDQISNNIDASLSNPPGMHLFGRYANQVEILSDSNQSLGLGLNPSIVHHAVKYEQALTVEDILARRWRTLFLDARLAKKIAPDVSSIMINAGIRDPKLEEFLALCNQHQI